MKLAAFQNLKKSQQGMTSVEFAIAGLATIVILFMGIEMGRLLFTVNTLAEATRRGARVAAVCDVADAAEIQRIAIFNQTGSGTNSPILRDLQTDNVVVEYLNENGGVIGNVGGAAYFEIRYVRVRITNYQYDFIIPGLDLGLTLPEYPTTVPRESLGVPRPGQISTCA